MGGGESKKRAEEEREDVSKRPEIKESMEECLAFIEAEEEREDAAAKRREIKESMEERLAFIEEYLSSLEPGPFFSRAGEKREDAAAKRREIMELKLKQEHLKREYLWSLNPGPVISPRQVVLPCDPGPIISRQKAGSPAPSCLSMKSDMSRESPPYFSNEPLPSDTKDPGIDAGLWRELNSMVSHVQNELDTLKRFVRAINPEGQGEYEEGVKCEGESAEKRQQRGISEDHTGLPQKN